MSDNKVIHHLAPKWMRDKLKAWNVQEHGRPIKANRWDSRARDVFGKAWDHWGKTKYEDGYSFVLEPYPHPDAIPDALAAAKKLGCEMRIEEVSWHNPGRCVRIEFFETKEEQS